MQPITLAEVLAARDKRYALQQQLLKEFHTPILSFSMNIPGPVKDTPLIRRAYRWGCFSIEAALKKHGLPILYEKETLAPTGCEKIYAVDGEPELIKQLCLSIEDGTPVGRLFDMDVLTASGEKLDRAQFQKPERGCIVCGAPGRGCASRRVHTVAELQEATRSILNAHVRATDPIDTARRVTAALLAEVYTTPKPGLVDRRNTGSHRDMDIETFRRSANALQPYWETCMRIGMDTANAPAPETFLQLRTAGRAAEATMYEATNGVNTHKGAIFLLGILCGAIGRLWRPERPYASIPALFTESRAMTHNVLDAELRAFAEDPTQIRTTGQKLYVQHGIAGARGEAANGFPSVQNVALPVFQKAKAQGFDDNDAGVVALLSLMAQGTDTNMIARGGMDLAKAAADEAKDLLSRGFSLSKQAIEAFDDRMIVQNLSPGGCADLLAVTLFVNALPKEV